MQLERERERVGAGGSVCQINTFTDEDGNDLITLSQYTCVRGGGGVGGIWRGAAGQGGQTKREITKSHSLLGDIKRARMLMYHEEHSLLNGHFTHFLCILHITLKPVFHDKELMKFLNPPIDQAHGESI